jgi:hypothetical protein
MLVPMLQALHMHIPMLTAKTQTGHLHTLAQVCCELPKFGSRKDLEDAPFFRWSPGRGPLCVHCDLFLIQLKVGMARKKYSTIGLRLLRRNLMP